MIEPEMAFVEFNENLEVQENYVSFIVQSVLENCKIELNTLGRDTSKLELIKAPFPRITYDEAIQFLKRKALTILNGAMTSALLTKRRLLKAMTSRYLLHTIRHH